MMQTKLSNIEYCRPDIGAVHPTYRLLRFLARDSIYAIARYMPSPIRLSVCLSLCLSHGWISQRRL